MRVVIKIGTQAILDEQGNVLTHTLSALIQQIIHLQKMQHQVILVSSGAVSSGRRLTHTELKREFGQSTGEKQMLASIGQPALMHVYATLLKPHGVLPAQLLLTKQDFQTRKHYLNITRILRELLEQESVLPIVNENDTVAIEELMFTDNDELSGLLAAQLNADRLILLTSVPGVYNGDPRDAASTIIQTIRPQNRRIQVSSFKSTLGRGGMASKLSIAYKMSALGIATHIAKSDVPDVLVRILNEESIGTTILPQKKKSSFKRWIAFHSGEQPGAILVNNCLFKLLAEQHKAISLLPIGIEQCIGHFKKGDLIDILGPERQKIGIGIVGYGSDILQTRMGLPEQPELIHYNHLYIYPI